jgi:hypothetical protein
MAAAGIAGLLLVGQVRLSAQQTGGPPVRIGTADLGGVVTSVSGPEAGVWVIAETADLPTRFIKIVVTDDQGRYVMPDLPKANYNVWVRGYGLVDSTKVQSPPGQIVNLHAVVAPNPGAAAPGRAYHSDRVEFTCSQTRSVFDRYYIVSLVDFQDVARRLAGTFRAHGGIQRLLPVR